MMLDVFQAMALLVSDGFCMWHSDGFIGSEDLIGSQRHDAAGTWN